MRILKNNPSSPAGAFHRNAHLGFTLLELLIVIGIMGLLGTVSVGGYRSLRKGIEERGTMQNVDEFVRAAYRRAVIDRVPVTVYFWNETISDETETHGGKLVVVGHAVAVRRGGRITKVSGNRLVDEFGDLAQEAYTDADGEDDTSPDGLADDPGRYLYKVPSTSFQRSLVASSTVRDDQDEVMISRPNQRVKIRAYCYYVKNAGGVTWNVGDAYGFEVAELTLPKNFIFGSSYSTDIGSPEKQIQVMNISGTGARTGGNVTVSGLQLDKQGAVAFKSIGTSEDPSNDR